MPAGAALDYFLYPGHALQFLLLRLANGAVLAGIAAILFFLKERLRTSQVRALGIVSCLLMVATFCWMMFVTDGVRSPYFAGIDLVLIAWATLLPWTVRDTAITCGVAFVLYMVAMVVHPGFSGEGAWALLGFNGSFIGITTMIALGITFFLSRVRFEDFSLRHQLDAKNRELQDLDRLKTQFFSNISHELRTPLTLILLPVEALLERSAALDERTHESLILVHRNTLRLLKLINDLLELTRLDQQADILRRRRFRLGMFVRGVVDSVRHLGLSKRLRIGIAEGGQDAEVFADPSRMEKVLVNLLTNAIKYTPAGGAITVRWAVEGTDARIEVEDTGVGIPKADQARIFDRFHQVRSNAANETQGIGIGLALAKELVEQHGGSLEVESEAGRGSLFRITLPADAPTAGVAAVEPAPRPALPEAEEEPFEHAFRSADRTWREPSVETDLPTIGHGEETVLVADDESDMRGYIVSLLSESYRVVQTATGANVADLVAEHEPRIVLLDWMMPGKDGLAVCRELRGRYPDMKIVLLTARIDERSKLDALEAGADDFLTKPFSSIELRTRVANLVRSAHLQTDLRASNHELSRTVEKLQRTEAMLIQSEKMNAIGSMSAGLLHEINNPLNYTLTAINFAKRSKDSLTPELQEVITDVEEGMHRIRDVITHLKTFAYPEKAGGTAVVFPLREAIDSAAKIVANELSGVQLEIDLPEGLAVNGQKTQIMHLFINLLGNAGKALHGRPEPRVISVRATCEDDQASIEVADNGPGVPPEIMTRIFEPFFTTRDVGAGMGLGLSICHTIVEAHGGAIRVGNRPEGGAVFTVQLPLAKEALNLC
jgi:signal transduction histidine kinase